MGIIFPTGTSDGTDGHFRQVLSDRHRWHKQDTKLFAVLSWKPIPHDIWRQIYNKKVRDNYTTGGSLTNTPQDNRRQKYTVGQL